MSKTTTTDWNTRVAFARRPARARDATSRCAWPRARLISLARAPRASDVTARTFRAVRASRRARLSTNPRRIYGTLNRRGANLTPSWPRESPRCRRRSACFTGTGGLVTRRRSSSPRASRCGGGCSCTSYQGSMRRRLSSSLRDVDARESETRRRRRLTNARDSERF